MNRQPDTPAPGIPVLPGTALRAARCHEACGPGATGFACVLAARLGGDVLWITERWRPERLNPVGYSRFADPARLVLARVKDQTEALAVAEDGLRAGAVALVVVEIGQPLSLLAGRRLHLAAEAGQTTALCLIPQGMGSNAAETRWQCAPVFAPDDSTLQRWEIIKNKTGTLTAWTVKWDEEARRLDVVCAPGERPGLAGAPG